METKPTLSQIQATARFHRRMEKVYKAQGDTSNEPIARKAAEALEAKADAYEFLENNVSWNELEELEG